MERLQDPGHPVFKSNSALSRGILKKKHNRDTIHFITNASNIDLLFRIFHSLSKLSIYGACEQFVLTEEEKGKKNRKIPFPKMH